MLRDAAQVCTGVNACIYRGTYPATRRQVAAGAPLGSGVLRAVDREGAAAGRWAVSPRVATGGITGGYACISIGKPGAPSTSKGYGVQPHVAKRYRVRAAVAPSLRWPLRSRPVVLVGSPSVRWLPRPGVATLAMKNRSPSPASFSAPQIAAMSAADAFWEWASEG